MVSSHDIPIILWMFAKPCAKWDAYQDSYLDETLRIMGLQGDKPSPNWCRIYSIHSINGMLMVNRC